MKLLFTIFYILGFNFIGIAQTAVDSVNKQNWSLHFQQTTITQYHPQFKAKYSGVNSMQTDEESQTSLTTTLFLARRLWNGAYFCFNPEIAGGAGLSRATGMAGFPNGETFRVGNPKPQVYIARAYLRQIIPLSSAQNFNEDKPNQLMGNIPSSYLSFTIGKLSLADFFDNNQFSHDPRSQFINWSLMSNGAWDYPANTRGYTGAFVAELVKPSWAIRFSGALVMKEANQSNVDWDISNASSYTLEWEKSYQIAQKAGKIRLLSFYTQAFMGNYQQASNLPVNEVDIVTTRTYGRSKYGFGLNIEQNLSENVGAFLRMSWNDGNNETWAFTEIDRSLSAGVSLKGNLWHRKEDVLGIAGVANGISKPHQTYLKAGGNGFMIGDGNLNYAPEIITEVYYLLRLHDKHFWLSPNYQFALNPAYNRDRGSIHIFALRFHVEF